MKIQTGGQQFRHYDWILLKEHNSYLISIASDTFFPSSFHLSIYGLNQKLKKKKSSKNKPINEKKNTRHTNSFTNFLIPIYVAVDVLYFD